MFAIYIKIRYYKFVSIAWRRSPKLAWRVIYRKNIKRKEKLVKYYLDNFLKDGEYKVHQSGRTQGAEQKNQIDLGYQASDYAAVLAVCAKYPQDAHRIRGCDYCCQ